MPFNSHPIITIIAVVFGLTLAGCQPAEQPADTVSEPAEEPVAESPVDRPNPLLDDVQTTPLGAPPFHRIEPWQFEPAIEAAMDEHVNQIQVIVNNPSAADFDNTIAALAGAGERLGRLVALLYGLHAATGDPELADIIAEQAPEIIAHNDRMLQDRGLLDRVRQVAEQHGPQLAGEQRQLLDLTLQRFHAAGSALDRTDRRRLRTLNAELAELAERYQARLAESRHAWQLLIEDEALVASLPAELILHGRRQAREHGHADGFVLTLDEAEVATFLRHAPDRSLRREVFKAWRHAGADQDRSALSEIIERMVALRQSHAELLGLANHAEFMLAESSFNDNFSVDDLLDRLLDAALEQAEVELEQLRQTAADYGIDGDIEPWDLPYLIQTQRQRVLELEDAELPEWFGLEQVRQGAFTLAGRLWGLSFHERADLPRYHPEVETFLVRDADGRDLGVLYLDYLARPGKQSGAWMSIYRPQSGRGDDRIAPVVANVAGFPRPMGQTPPLLQPDQAVTLFHEFGHALHAIFSEAEYAALAGTNVPADFVEFPALLFEHWALTPELLRLYAFHHQTGAALPDALSSRLADAWQIGSAIELAGQVLAARLELAWHRIGSDQEIPAPEAMEAGLYSGRDIAPVILPALPSTAFIDAFGHAHGQGHYRHLWARVLAADAFAAFTETGVLDRETADRLRDEILARGNTRPVLDSFEAFRGRPPEMSALIDSISYE